MSWWSELRQWLKDRLIDARRQQRSSGTVDALLVEGGREHRVRLIDRSPYGAMVEAVELPERTQISLHVLDQPPVRGQVRWAREGRMGLSFDEPEAPLRKTWDEQ